MASPIDLLIDRSGLRCTKCGATKEAGCDCWELCSCGWTTEKGMPCGNPNTTRCSSKARAWGFRASGRSRRGWHPIADATSDGYLCALRFEDAQGFYESNGPFFFHDDGYWYLAEPPAMLTIQPVAFKHLKN